VIDDVEANKRAEKAEADVERLRELCANRPEMREEWRQSDMFMDWIENIDAAGREEE